jgi:hypothetical protein
MSLNTGYAKLNLALDALRLRWDETRAHWNDPVSQRFEEDYWLSLERQVQDTLRETDQLAHALVKARQECG